MLSKGKNFEEMCVYTTTAIHNYLFRFTFLPLHANSPSIPADSAGDKNVAFDFSDACIFGHAVYNYFDYQDFLSFASDFISTCESLRNVYEKLSKV